MFVRMHSHAHSHAHAQVGSALSPLLMKRYRTEVYMKWVFGLASLSLAVPFLFHLDRHTDLNGAWGVVRRLVLLFDLIIGARGG